MTIKSLACAAALLAIGVTPAFAVPAIQWVDNGNDTATLQVVPSGTGSIATEILVTADFDLTSAVVADAVSFDFDNPGNNPITATVTTGLYLDLGNDQLFGSHGSIVFASTTPVDYLTVGFTGSGTINASGLLAEGGAIFSGLSEDLVISGSKVPGDTDGDGDVDLLDLDALGANFGLATGATCAEGDFDGDGDVDLLDLDILGANFGTTPSASVPEPTALALAALAGVALLGRRI